METTQPEPETEPPRLIPAILAPLAPGRREWILGLAGIMLLVQLVLVFLPGLIGALLGLIAILLLSGTGFNAGVEQLRLAAAGPGGRGARRFTSEQSEWLAARLIILWVIASIALAAGMQTAGHFGLLVAVAIVALLLPAVTLILALTNAFLEALFPPRVMQLIVRIGHRDYGLLIAMILAGALAYMILASVLGWLGLFAPIRFSLMFGLWVWAVLAWFQLGGEVLWHHRDELNLSAELSDEQRERVQRLLKIHPDLAQSRP